MYFESTQGIEITAKPEYLSTESSPQESQFVFSYEITIANKGETEVQLISRHWIITDGHGHVEEVKGLGVIGAQPKLKPGESHTYTSFCPLTTPTGNMRGTYHMQNTLGAHFDVKIPLFFLREMNSLH
ncbi:MAG: Co2+/Mg2+ efflux protein ApaG [Xanthomonadaceae bacterium]|nr:Co2+/Mg2+ efflux protein ApaG [Xanthomonadaceae bacterium]